MKLNVSSLFLGVAIGVVSTGIAALELSDSGFNERRGGDQGRKIESRESGTFICLKDGSLGAPPEPVGNHIIDLDLSEFSPQ